MMSKHSNTSGSEIERNPYLLPGRRPPRLAMLYQDMCRSHLLLRRWGLPARLAGRCVEVIHAPLVTLALLPHPPRRQAAIRLMQSSARNLSSREDAPSGAAEPPGTAKQPSKAAAR